MVKRYCKRTYKKLNAVELEQYRKENTIIINKEESKIDDKNIECYKKAGNEGKKHSDKKIEIAFILFQKFKDKFKDIELDGVWFEYPLISIDNKLKFSKYDQKKIKYLYSLYQPIISSEDTYIKNLHNIFNPNLKSRLRGRKSLKSLNIEKVVDIAVVCNGNIVKIIEVNISNKLTQTQTNLINKLYPDLLEEI